MIRKFQIDDLDIVMNLWLETNIRAHDFIDKSYWLENYEIVKMMLPDSAILIYEEDGVILGFVGLIDTYIAGIFVDEKSQSKGIGKALLDYVKENHSELSLQVYRKNNRAIQFYIREGFVVSKEQIDENTGETDLVLNWKSDSI